MVTLHNGDCLAYMQTMEPDSVDTIITDPPYALTNRVADVPACNSCGRQCGGSDGVKAGDPCPRCGAILATRRTMAGAGFMGKDWDNGLVAFSPELWREALRVAKPGALLLAFGGTRTVHRLTCAIEDAGWEIRDTIMWVYGSGFPKSHDISKAIDKAAGAEREVARVATRNGNAERRGIGEQGAAYGDAWGGFTTASTPVTPLASLWNGWGTALKPAYEPIIIAMKPLDGTFAANAEKWGVAGLWVDGGRVEALPGDYDHPGNNGIEDNRSVYGKYANGNQQPPSPLGRWPANLIHDGSDEVVGLFPETGARGNVNGTKHGQAFFRNCDEQHTNDNYQYDLGGSAARFFYCAKASRAEREMGLEGIDRKRDAHNLSSNACARCGKRVKANGCGDKCECGDLRETVKLPTTTRNSHPTVKPLALMRYLCRLTKTPTGGVVLDPFMGSGTTGAAAVMEGRDFIGCDTESEYVEIARRRIAAAQPIQPELMEVTE